MNDDTSSAKNYWEPLIYAYLDGKTVLPAYLGLTPETFTEICMAYDFTEGTSSFSGHNTPQHRLLSELATLRQTERLDLVSLLNQYRNPQCRFSEEMTEVLSYACLGTQHLWRDLGMPVRPLLTRLFGFYYPQLREMNNKNMRWKRFLYRQLCTSGGDYVCRSPSCESCTSFHECFAEEEMSEFSG